MRRLALILSICALASACAAVRPCECCFSGEADPPAAHFRPLSR